MCATVIPSPAAGHTSATAVAALIQEQIVQGLTANFHSLPVCSQSPVNPDRLRAALSGYPNQLFVEQLVYNFTEGFSIGYDGPEFSNTSHNLNSALSHPSAIYNTLIEELKHKRIAGPLNSTLLPYFRTSPIGVVPKKDSHKFRIITDLSSPAGISINDFIADSEASVSFNNFDSATELIFRIRQGALMAKLDVKSAFRICPVRPTDCHYLGFSFMNMFFVDLCLPFGL